MPVRYHWRCYHRVQTRDPRHSPHSDGSVPGAGIGTKLWPQSVPNQPPNGHLSGVGFFGGHIRNIWRLPEMPVRVELMHRGMPSTEMGERPGSLSVRDSPTRGRGVALRVFGRKAGCGSYPKGRRSIVPNVHGPRLARRLPAEQGASKTHAVYPGVCGIERVLQLFRCAGGNFRSATGRRTDGWRQGLFGRKADSPVHTRRGEGPSFQMLGEPPRAGAGRDLRCGVPAGP